MSLLSYNNKKKEKRLISTLLIESRYLLRYSLSTRSCFKPTLIAIAEVKWVVYNWRIRFNVSICFSRLNIF